MANFYVSANRGNDSTGTGSANNPVKTISAAIGATPKFTLDAANPNFLYIEPGLYREAVSVGVAPVSAGPLSIIGDCNGAGFAAGGYSNPTLGSVDWRAWSDDLTPLSAGPGLLSNSANYVSVSHVEISGGSYGLGAAFFVNGSSTNWTFTDCIFNCLLNQQVARVASSVIGAWNVTIDRCDFYGGPNGSILAIACLYNATEYNINTLIQNCRFYGRGSAIAIGSSGATSTALGTGISIQNCTAALGCNVFVAVSYSTMTLTTPISVHGSAALGVNYGFQAGNTSQISEDGNIIIAANPYQNTTNGPNSKTTYFGAVNFGSSRLTGTAIRPHLEPKAGGILVGFGNWGTTPTVDVYDQTRPAAASAGALEIDTFTTGSNYIFQVEG